MDLMTYLLAQKGGGGGGSDLPVVTPADNGKILGVVSGAWSTVNPDTVIDLPMTLQVGTQESPVYLSELDEGLYAINGKYYILRNSESFETDYNIIALVSKEEGLDRAKIKIITADDVTDYDIKENGSSIAVYTNKIVTEKYLNDNHYVIETDLAGYMPKISNPFGGIIVESTSEGTIVETGYNITELNNRIDTAYETGYSAGKAVASKMNQFSSAPAGAGYIVITNGSSQNSVGVADIKAENILTGYSNHDGFIAVWDKEHGNHIADAGIAASNVATKSFVGSIPQSSSSTTIVDYIDEIGSNLIPKMQNAEGDKVVTSNSDGSVSESDIDVNDLARWDSSGTTGYILVQTAEGGINSAPIYPNDIVTGNIYSQGDEVDYLMTSDHTSSGNKVVKSSITTTGLVTGYDLNGFDSDEHYGEIIIAYGNPGDYNKIDISGVKVKDLATNAFVGEIPQTSSATTIIDYIDEVTTPIKPIPNTPTSIATFGGAAALPMPSLKVGIEAVQSGSGDPSPTNIRPFTGWSAVNVYDTKKNLADIGTITLTRYKTVNISLKPNTYTISAIVTSDDTDASTCLITPRDEEDNIIDYLQISRGSDRTSVTFTSQVNIKSIRFYSSDTSAHAQGDSATYTDVQLEIDDTSTSYEAYSGQTYTTQLKDGQGNPLTCYGGELNNVNGVQTLTDECVLAEFDGSNDETWVKRTTEVNQYFAIKIGDNGSVIPGVTFGLSNEFQVVSVIGSNKNIGVGISNSSAYNGAFINVRPTGFEEMTLADFITFLSNNPLQVLYKRATPQTIPQDNLAIATQDGTNNLWADSGYVIEGSYRAARYQDIYTYGALPSVMSSDNGKLLQVVNGTWQAVDLDANSTSY